MTALVTPHFSAAEFAQQARHGQPYLDYPAEWIAERLLPLCRTLERVRLALPVAYCMVISGYRSWAYNRAIGGAAASQHPDGRAADVAYPGHMPGVVLALVLELHARGELLHLGGLGLYPGWVHLDVRPLPADGRIAQWTGARRES